MRAGLLLELREEREERAKGKYLPKVREFTEFARICSGGTPEEEPCRLYQHPLTAAT